jgi:hypothetical protein
MGADDTTMKQILNNYMCLTWIHLVQEEIKWHAFAYGKKTSGTITRVKFLDHLNDFKVVRGASLCIVVNYMIIKEVNQYVHYGN